MPISKDGSDKPHRFYKVVSVAPDSGGFAVQLDGRGAKTPAGSRLVVPVSTLAELLAAEWTAQADQIDYVAMPATRLAFTAIDRTPRAKAAVANEMAKLIDADQLCYFATGPDSLAQRQEQLWGPWLTWAQTDLRLALVRAAGITHKPQPPETLAQVQALAESADAFTLSGLAFAGGLYGSAILAFAVQAGALSGEAAFDLSRLDEAFQEERWGVDHEAAERTENMRQDARMIGAWFDALRAQARV